MEQNRYISVKEAIEKDLCTEMIEGKTKWLIEKSTNKKLINTPIGGNFKERLLVSPENKILGWLIKD